MMITNLHFRLQFPDNVLIRVRPRALECIEDDVRMSLLLFQQPTYNENR